MSVHEESKTLVGTPLHLRSSPRISPIPSLSVFTLRVTVSMRFTAQTRSTKAPKSLNPDRSRAPQISQRGLHSQHHCFHNSPRTISSGTISTTIGVIPRPTASKPTPPRSTHRNQSLRSHQTLHHIPSTPRPAAPESAHATTASVVVAHFSRIGRPDKRNRDLIRTLTRQLVHGGVFQRSRH